MDRSSWSLPGSTEKSDTTEKSSAIVNVGAEAKSVASASSDAPKKELRYVHGSRVWTENTNIFLSRR